MFCVCICGFYGNRLFCACQSQKKQMSRTILIRSIKNCMQRVIGSVYDTTTITTALGCDCGLFHAICFVVLHLML